LAALREVANDQRGYYHLGGHQRHLDPQPAM